MSRYRVWLVCTSLAGVLAMNGCAMMNSGKNWFTGKSADDPSVEDVEDKWAFVGKEGRGGRTVEKGDWLDQVLWSEKAQQINRNLGYEY